MENQDTGLTGSVNTPARPNRTRNWLPFTVAGTKRFPDYGWAYYNYLSARFRALPPPSDPAAQLIFARIESRLNDVETRPEPRLSWNDLATIEALLLEVESEVSLRREAWSLRERYRRVARTDEYAVYEASGCPDPKNAPLPELRSDLVGLATLLHFHYDLRTQSETLRDHLSKWVAGWAIAACSVGLALLVVEYCWKRHGTGYPTLTPLLVYVILMGALGGFISVQRRLQQSPLEGDTLSDVISLEHGRKTTIAAPLQGAIFAVVLYLIFASGAVSGSFFPSINTVIPNRQSTGNADASGHADTAENDEAVGNADVAGRPDAATPGAAVVAKRGGGSDAAEGPPQNGRTQATGTARQPHGTGSARDRPSNAVPAGGVALSPSKPASGGASTSTEANGRPTGPAKKLPQQAGRNSPPGSDNERSITFRKFLDTAGPKDAANLALVLVWSFLAGFAERLVPDTLDRLTVSGPGTKSRPAAQPASPG